MTVLRKPDAPLTFVSVASYRDPELVPTITDCLARARHPERLRFGICWQHGDDEQLPAWMRGEQFRVIDVDWRQSRGVCWARAEIMRRWDGEDWYLQLDSHHRFAADWDVKLSRQLARVDSDLALLTTYAAAYTPGIDDPEPHVTRMGFDHFTPEGAILTRPWVLVDSPPDPIPAQFVSAHLLFAPGRFVEHVPYDPELYFIGEETTIALRAFTRGYDLFHPGEHIAWHEYTRVGRTKHWDDHTSQRVAGTPWHERDATSRAKVMRLLQAPWNGRFGLGTERTLEDYEVYAGLSFRERRVLNAAPEPAPAPAQPPRAGRVGGAGREGRPTRQGRASRPVYDRPSIFIGIASYRDPDLEATIRDCLATARHPERLHIGVAWQHGPDEVLPAALTGEHVRILDISWRQSRGTCWARAQAMRLWDGEDWYLQLDSHHRFARHWDETLLRQAALTGSPRPVLSAPAPGFTIGAPPPAADPWRIDIDRFNGDGLPATTIGRLPTATIAARVAGVVPVRARCVCAHLLFAPGSFVADVPADPELYLSGEETIASLRAFTHGYDLFHPSEVVAWHAYDRDHRVAHWHDHAQVRGVARPWYELRRLGLHRYSRLIAQARAGGGGFGRERTLADYEAYAGISFRHRRVQDYTRCHHEPPNPPADPGWPARVRDRRIEIALDIAALPRPALEDPTFWYVGVHAADGDELFRHDASSPELGELLGGGEGRIRLVREFTSEAVPATWTVMPHSASRGWLEPIAGPA